MALGLCCQWLAPNPKKKFVYENILRSRNLQLGKFNRGQYTEQKIKQTYIDNLMNLLEVLPLVIEAGIRVFRISSAMFPLFDKVPESYWHNKETLNLLNQIGSLIKNENVRATTHPGQFVVLSSDKESTVSNAIKELEFHAWLMDKMGLDRSAYYSINIHGGKGDRAEQLIANVDRLNESARSRLTLENCEFAYSIKDLFQVALKTGVPLCFDSHHHSFNTGGLSSKDAMEIALSTWPEGIRPLTHLSNSKPEYRENRHPITKSRQHSDYIDYIPEHQLQANNTGLIDIDIEAKMKNLAILEVSTKHDLRLV